MKINSKVPNITQRISAAVPIVKIIPNAYMIIARLHLIYYQVMIFYD
jgi:hypothetical protein